MNATVGQRRNRKPGSTIVIASAFTAVTLWVGYLGFGLITMLIFTGGFVGGLLLWLLLPARGSWADIKAPYWIALLLFVLHRIEESRFGFFKLLAAATGVPTPAISSPPVVLVLVVSVGAWLLVPVLMAHDVPFGRYLAWMFFASMGITELAHFVIFPWVGDAGPHYVPGMWTVIALAPVAWWGMRRLVSGTPSAERLTA